MIPSAEQAGRYGMRLWGNGKLKNGRSMRQGLPKFFCSGAIGKMNYMLPRPKQIKSYAQHTSDNNEAKTWARR